MIFEETGVKGRDLKLDSSTRRLLWFDETFNRIVSINLKGNDVNYVPIPGESVLNKIFLFTDLGNGRPQFLTASGGKIYFFNDMSITSLSENDTLSLAAHVHMSFSYRPYTVKIYSESEQVKSELRYPMMIVTRMGHITNICICFSKNEGKFHLCPRKIRLLDEYG